MSLIQDDHMIEQITAAVTDPALGDTVLPRTSEAGSFWLDAKGLQGVDGFFVEVRVSIKDQVVGRRVLGERLAQLLDDPGTGRMFRHIKMEDTPPVMRNDEKTVEHAESKRMQGEEIHRCYGLTMIAQKRGPTLCRLRISRGFSHPTQHGSFRNVEAQHS
jgi:hypothetical protein